MATAAAGQLGTVTRRRRSRSSGREGESKREGGKGERGRAFDVFALRRRRRRHVSLEGRGKEEEREAGGPPSHRRPPVGKSAGKSLYRDLPPRLRAPPTPPPRRLGWFSLRFSLFPPFVPSSCFASYSPSLYQRTRWSYSPSATAAAVALSPHNYKAATNSGRPRARPGRQTTLPPRRPSESRARNEGTAAVTVTVKAEAAAACLTLGAHV